MIKFDKNEFEEPMIYSSNDEDEVRCKVKEEIVNDIKYLQNEKQQLISFLEDKIKECKEKYGNYVYDDYSVEKATYDTYQEVLDFVKKGGKE